MAKRLNHLRGLRAFRTAARLLSFTRAAEELNITQGAISRQIKGLEDVLGVELFRRQKRSLRLTDEGRHYLPQIEDALNLLDRATASLATGQKPPKIQVRVPPTLALRWLIPRLHDFQKRHPDIELRLATSLGATLEECDLERNEIDIAIARVSSPEPDDKLRFEYLMNDDHVPVCSKKLLGGAHPLRTPTNLSHHMLLHAVTRPHAWRSWVQFAHLDGIDTEHGLFFDHYHFALQAAIEGLGVAVAPQPLVAADVAEGRLVIPFGIAAPSGTAYYLIYLANRAEVPAVEAFRNWILAESRSAPSPIEAAAEPYTSPTKN